MDLNSIICPTFRSAFIDILEHRVDRVVFKGGRGSTKSQTTWDAIVADCMRWKASSCAFVVHENKVEQRLVNACTAAMNYLGVRKYWKLKKKPWKYVLLDAEGKETDVEILFFGVKDPSILKSLRAKNGCSFLDVFFEECNDFRSFADLNNLCDTLLRGACTPEGIDKHTAIFAYNPPMSTSAWVNKEFDAPCGVALGYSSNYYYSTIEFDVEYDMPTPEGSVHIKRHEVQTQLIHHSTYLDVLDAGHYDWLSSSMMGRIEQSKQNNFRYYQWNYLGVVTGTDANVFDNIHIWDGNTKHLDLSTVYRGLDFSNGGPDPNHFVVWHYDSRNRDLYLLDEWRGVRCTTETVVYELKKRNPHNFVIRTDGAVPILTQQLNNKGLNCYPAKKGPDSVRAGIQWLQSLNHIYISENTPFALKEFKEYEYKIDRITEEVTSELKDCDNHSIDATRYALVDFIKYETD